MRAKSEVTAERLVESAAAVIRRDGLQACTHRAVAAEAGMSLGTTTYHFKTLDALFAAVMERAIADFQQQTTRWLAQQHCADPVATLADFIFWTLAERPRLTTEYELFVAAVSRPLLRSHASAWIRCHEQLLAAHFGFTPGQAQAAVSFTDAWLMRGLLTGPASLPDRAVLTAVFASIVHPPEAGTL